jgi:hypothetical protein
MKHIVTRSVYRLDPKEVLVAQIRQQLMPRPQTVMGEIKIEDSNKRRVGTCVGQPRRKIKLEANPFVISDSAL